MVTSIDDTDDDKFSFSLPNNNKKYMTEDGFNAKLTVTIVEPLADTLPSPATSSCTPSPPSSCTSSHSRSPSPLSDISSDVSSETLDYAENSNSTPTPYPESDIISRRLKYVYRTFGHICDLYFAVDKVLGNLGEQRKRAPTVRIKTGVQMLGGPTGSTEPHLNIPPTVGPGYGELARVGFDKLIHYLSEEAPEPFRLDAESSFLDIGSGFGKCVVHAKLRANVKKSRGIEYVPLRHAKAREVLYALDSRFCPGLTDAPSFPFTDEEKIVDLTGVQLYEGDITNPDFAHLLYDATHIYMFDVVFTEEALARILPLIEQTNFTMFACYHRPAYLERLGCRKFVRFHQIQTKTTGKQSFTCYFYFKEAPHEIRTRQRTRPTIAPSRKRRISQLPSNPTAAVTHNGNTTLDNTQMASIDLALDNSIKITDTSSKKPQKKRKTKRITPKKKRKSVQQPSDPIS